MIQLTVKDLLEMEKEALGLSLLAGEDGLWRRILKQRIQKCGLVLTGLYENVHKGRIQIIGQNEIDYLSMLPDHRQKEVLRGVASREIPCYILTRGLTPPVALLDVSKETALPILQTNQISSTFIINLSQYLEANLAASTSIHGVLVDVLGVGVLIMGKSGIGKSECALELLLKGHRLVADDIVEVKKSYPKTLWGFVSPVIKHHMEIRGLGIIDIAELFGVTSVRDRKQIQMVLELVEWSGNVEYDRLGLERQTYSILEIDVPKLTVPVSKGRNVSTVIEVAARNYLLQEKGIYSALSFQKKLDSRILKERRKKEP